jgi:hypothetical protein
MMLRTTITKLEPRNAFPHADCPMMQSLRATRGVLAMAEHNEIESALCEPPLADVVVAACANGFDLYGRSDVALARAVARVGGDRWRHVRIEPATVRFLMDPLREPWMSVQVRGPRTLARFFKDELARCGGRIELESFLSDVVRLRASAPMTGVVDYRAAVERRAGNAVQIGCTLDHWRCVDEPEPPLSAA